MALAIVTVAGRTFRVGCEAGQETRLEELAALVDAKVSQMRANFGEIGDQRLLVMGALELADEAADQRQRVGALEETVAALRAEVEELQRREAAAEAHLSQAVAAAAERLERLAQDLSNRDYDADPLA